MQTRRQLLGTFAGMGLGLAAPSLYAQAVTDQRIADSLKAEGQLLIYWPGGSNFKKWLTDTLVAGFEKHIKASYGVDLQIALLSTGGGDAAFWQKFEAYRRGGAKPSSGFPIDVVRVAPDIRTLTAINEGAFLPLSDRANLIPNLSKVNAPGLATFTVGNKAYASPMFQPTVSMFFNKDQVAAPPRTLDSLADWVKSNPRKFAYEDPRSSSGIGSGVMFLLGVMKHFGKPDDANTWQKGWDFLKSIQPYVYPSPNTGEQLLELMRRGEVSLMPFWNDWGLFAKEQLKLPFLDNYLIEDGMPIRNTPIAIPKGSKHPIAASLFVNWAISDEVQASLGREQRQLPANLSASVLAQIPEQAFGFSMDTLKKYTFPAFNSKQSIEAIGKLAEGWSTNVLGR